ncbi:MAG TPA: thioredoxin-dependent thiol peroxidase, partial [Candidatus Saccharimonadales bacterium]|nr:thioredoxin-dependent thiol peroxidase [Candidatus Saccharimonadales bacterium]
AAKSKAKRPARAASTARPVSRPKGVTGTIRISRLPAGATRGVSAKVAMKGKAKMAARSGGGPQGLLEFADAPPSVAVKSAPAHIGPPPMPKKRRGKGGQLNMLDYPGESLTVGMPAPEFSLPSTLGRRVTLSEFRGKRVILYFYPKDDTPGCTMEACGFRDSFPRIESKDAVVLGVSLDDELSHERFAQKFNLPFPLLADKDAAVSRQYGTYKEKSLYGRSFWGIERTTFVIDREGKVEHVFRRVKVEGHAEEVMATLAL